MPKEELTHKIYLATFDQPRYTMEIGELIYGKKQMTYPKLMGKKGAIQKCLDRDWIKEVKIMEPKDKPKGFDQRQYYEADIGELMKRINEYPVIISDNYVFESILKSNSFRYLIKKECIKKMEEFSGVDAFEFILGYLDSLFVISELTIYQIKKLENKFKGIKTKVQYNKVIKEIKKDNKVVNKLKKITQKFFEEKELPPEVIEDIFYLFVIPRRLSWGHEGFSNIGKLYYRYIEVFKGLVQLFEK